MNRVEKTLRNAIQITYDVGCFPAKHYISILYKAFRNKMHAASESQNPDRRLQSNIYT